MCFAHPRSASGRLSEWPNRSSVSLLSDRPQRCGSTLWSSCATSHAPRYHARVIRRQTDPVEHRCQTAESLSFVSVWTERKHTCNARRTCNRTEPVPSLSSEFPPETRRGRLTLLENHWLTCCLVRLRFGGTAGDGFLHLLRDRIAGLEEA